MIPNNKKENLSSSNPSQDISYNSQTIKENPYKHFPIKNNLNYKNQSPKNIKKKILKNTSKKRVQFSDLSFANLINNIKRQNCCYSAMSKEMKPFSAFSSINKIPKNMTIKSLENYIKQKILDMSMKFEKNDNFKIENSNNSNIAMPISMSKNIKKFNIENIHENSPHLLNIKKNKKKLIINNDHSKKEFSKKTKEKIFRKIDRKNIVYDSIDDSDSFYERDGIGFYISSDSAFTLIFDSCIILCTLFDVIYTPFRTSLTICFCMNISQIVKYIYNCIDILYISDLIFCFFRSHYNEDSKIIKETEITIKNYFKNQFILDFLEAIPIFSIISFLCKNNGGYCIAYSFSFKQALLLFFCYFKQLKLIKIIDRKKNSLTNKLLDIFTNKHNIEKKLEIVKWTIFCLYAIYSFISIHIFIGHLSYPNWIISINFQNQNYFSLYITSFYFLMATVSTVGYGDIVCKSIIEICIQIIFLTFGVIIYSWIVSNIGNYIKNQDHAVIKCNKDKHLLEEIRIAYPEMPFKLYHQILQHLKSRRLRQQKCEANILINSLPYYLRNQLLLTMYKQTTDQLKIFKNCSNSDFIIKLLTNFIPLFSKKNGLLIDEGQLIENIVFVNDGRLALEASIDIEFPENSIYQYINVKFKDIIEVGGSTFHMDSSSKNGSYIFNQNFTDYKRAENILDKVINCSNIKNAVSCLDETSIGKQVGKYDYEGNFDESNFKYINIINIIKNESYGSVYMFLNKPSPLSLRVKSKKAELLLLRKFDAFKISKLHPNIWKRFQRKAYLNMVSIKNLTINILKNYCKNNDIIPMGQRPSIKYINDIAFHDFNNSSDTTKDFVKGSNKDLIKYFTNSDSNQTQELKTSSHTIDKGMDKIEDKEQVNDLMSNINKVIENKKNDNINENENITSNLNKETNKKLKNELKTDVKNIENDEIPNVTKNKLILEDQNKNIENKNLSSKKTTFFSVKNISTIQKIYGNIETNKKTNSLNLNSATFSKVQKKSTNFDQNQCINFGSPNESKKGISVANSGFYSFRNTFRNSDKKNEIIGNEKTEYSNKFTYTFNNQTNREYKSSNISNIPSFINKKRTQTQVKYDISSNSTKENRLKSKLNSVGKIRLRFIRKLTKKIKILKTEKKKYKTLSKSLTHDINEFVRKQTTKEEITTIKNSESLENIENKKLINNTEDKKKSRISNENNEIINGTLKDAKKFLTLIPEFSSSESSDEISSSTQSKHFDLNEITISSPIRFMFKSKYKNLNIISFGYYAKSKKLRKLVINIINGFLSIKKRILNEEEQIDNKKGITYKKQNTYPIKNNFLNECPFQYYKRSISENKKQFNHKIRKNLQVNSDSHYKIKQRYSIHMHKKYENDENIENIINDKNCGKKFDNKDKNYNPFIVNVPDDQGESNINIIKMKNMNYLSIPPSRETISSTNIKNKRKNHFIMNNFKQKIFNNSGYEYEHIFANNIIRGNLKKNYSANEDSSLMKINSINFFYIRNNTTKYLTRKKLKIEETNISLNNKSNINSNENNKSERGIVKTSNNNNCYIF